MSIAPSSAKTLGSLLLGSPYMASCAPTPSTGSIAHSGTPSPSSPSSPAATPTPRPSIPSPKPADSSQPSTQPGSQPSAAPSGQTPPVTSLKISGSLNRFFSGRGQTLQLTFEARDAAGNLLDGAPVEWTSSRPQDFSITPGGLVTALVDDGYSEIQARVGSTASAPLLLSVSGAAGSGGNGAGQLSVQATPDSGSTGDAVTLTGSGFAFASQAGDNQIGFGAASGVVTATSACQLTVQVPETPAGVFNLSLQTGGRSLSAGSFTIRPRLSAVSASFSERGTPVLVAGQTLILTGTNFDPTPANNKLFFANLAVTPVTASATQLSVIVPGSLLSEGAAVNLSIETNGLRSNSVSGVTRVAAFTGFSPSQGAVGTLVTLTGRHFTGATQVTFNGTNAPGFTVVNDTTITVAVPTGSSPGPIRIVTPYGLLTSAQNFGVIRTPVITGFMPASAAPGETVVFQGSGFTGVTEARFDDYRNGGTGVVSPSFTVDSDTQITAVVPTTDLSNPYQQPSLLNAAGRGQAAATLVRRNRVWYINANATGARTGYSWADAASNAQSVLVNFIPGDEGWFATGTYKPGSLTGDAFVIDKVQVYGGFAGNETNRSQRNPTLYPTILSGDLQNDDNTAVTPFTSPTANSQTVVKMQGNATSLIDGFTIQGGTEHGIIVNNGGTLNQLLVRNNKASDRGGGIYFVNDQSTLSNSVISRNYAGSGFPGGGGAYLFSTTVTMDNVTFADNAAIHSGAIEVLTGTKLTLRNSSVLRNTATNGAAVMAERGGIVDQLQNVVLANNMSSEYASMYLENIQNNSVFDRVAIVGNTGPSPFTFSAVDPDGNPVNLKLQNLLLANNTSTGTRQLAFGGSGASAVTLQNATLANNFCSGAAGNVCSVFNSSALSTAFNNVLYWKDTPFTPTTGSGNVNLGSGGAPFLDPANPIGVDNVWFTGDDGFTLTSSAATAINMGTNAGAPAQDITLRNRVGLPEPGAYEYIP